MTQNKLPSAEELVKEIGELAFDAVRRPSDGEEHSLAALLLTRKYTRAVLEAAAEMADNLLDAARDPWEIPGEIRKLKEET